MKLFILAIAALAIAGAGVAAAQTSVNAGADVKAGGAANANANVKAKASTHTRKHHATTGRGGIETRDNNASARGSLLPGKDRLNSKAFIEDH